MLDRQEPKEQHFEMYEIFIVITFAFFFFLYMPICRAGCMYLKVSHAVMFVAESIWLHIYEQPLADWGLQARVPRGV